MPALAERFTVIAPDIVGFGFTYRPDAVPYGLDARAPQRVDRLVLMGACGVSFPLTEGLDAVWGYTPSLSRMRELLDIFAFDRSLVTDELAQLRYAASVRPGFQESFAAMFRAPRQRWVGGLATPEDQIAALAQPTLVIHGRDDHVIPLENAYRLLDLIDDSRLHVFGRCGRWTQLEHVREFTEIVGDFLAGGCPSVRLAPWRQSPCGEGTCPGSR